MSFYNHILDFDAETDHQESSCDSPCRFPRELDTADFKKTKKKCCKKYKKKKRCSSCPKR